MKSSYYDILDKYYGGFCGDGDRVEVVDENKQCTKGIVQKCSITCISFQTTSSELWTVPRTSVVSIEHCIQEKNHIPVEPNDLISMPQGDDRDIRCLGVVTRVNAPYASIRVLTGQQIAEVFNVWLKKLQFVAKGFSLDLYNEMEEEEMNISYNSLPACLNLVADQFTSISELFNPLMTRAKLLTNPLFRSDVMANDKLKRWGKGMIRKTKAMANLLSTPTEASERVSQSPVDGPIGSPSRYISSSSDEELVIARPGSRGKSSLSSEVNSSLGRRQSGGHSEFGSNRSEDSSRKNGKNFFSRIFKGKKKEGNERRNSLRSRGSDRDSLLSDIDKRDVLDNISGSYDPTLERYSYDAAMLQRRASDRVEYEGNRCSSPARIHRSHYRYRSYSDDLNGNSSKGLDLLPLTPAYLNEGAVDVWTDEDDFGEQESRVWLNVNACVGSHSRGSRKDGMNRHGIQSYHSPPPAQPSSPNDSVISDQECESLEEDEVKNESGLIRPESTILKEKGGVDLTRVSDSSLDSDSDLLDMAQIDTQPASLPTSPALPSQSSLPSGFYGSRGTVSPLAASQDLVDLSALGIPFAPSENLGVVPPSIARMSPPEKPESPRIVTEKEEMVPEGLVNPRGVRRSRQIRMEKGIGYRSIPPFRRRVAFLPPLPIATCKSLEKPQEGKQVRFFTNVLCHEYRSY